MKIDIIYVQSLKNRSGILEAFDERLKAVSTATISLTRRDALRIGGIGVWAALVYLRTSRPTLAQGSELIRSRIDGLDVAHPVLSAGSTQTSLASVRNESERRAHGIIVADFRTNGILTDQGDEEVTLPPSSFAIARITGDVGSKRGAGSSTAYTQINSKSISYQVE